MMDCVAFFWQKLLSEVTNNDVLTAEFPAWLNSNAGPELIGEKSDFSRQVIFLKHYYSSERQCQELSACLGLRT